MSLIFLTPGDPDGIGPEIVVKAVRKMKKKWSHLSIVCVGAKRPLEKMGARFTEISPDEIPLLKKKKRKADDFFLLSAPSAPKKNLSSPGYQSGWSIETATNLVKKNPGSALVTGPIHKGRLNEGGYHYAGHTDFLSHLCGDVSVTMMLANETLRISLVTTHIGLKDVPKALTRKKIMDTSLRTFRFLKNDLGIKKPKIAVCALNPHAGENGLFGREDDEIVAPSVRELKKRLTSKATITGPHPSDTFFANHVSQSPKSRADAVICMYHDQGLIPVKLIDFPNTVNVTLGLPLIRTSVDHGTAFDIAGKNIANPSSLIAAVNMAAAAVRTQGRKKRK